MAELFSAEEVRRELELHARALEIPEGAAEVFIDKAMVETEKALARKKIITQQDLSSAVSKVLKKYHGDFAYVYKNRDKIV